MSIHKIIPYCSVCSAVKTALPEEITAKCDICGSEFEADTTCENGHYVCHDCRQRDARERMIEHCLASKQTDPTALVFELMKLPRTMMHGPEHHLLVPAALLTCYCNLHHLNTLADWLAEANKRSLEVPGGACGFWGACGATIGAGIFVSIVSGTTPFSEDAWRTAGQTTSRCLNAVSAQGGPRCCKRDVFITLREALPYCNDVLDAEFPAVPDIRCEFFANNDTCKGIRCPFFPAKKNKQY